MLSVDITKDSGSFRLDVAFETDGEVMGLLGASGCGKSMTLKCIAGIERPDSGRIVLNDRVLFDSRERINIPTQKRRVGYLFQQYALFPNMTVEQNIAVGCKAADKRKKAGLVAAKLREMRLEGLEKNKPHQLSGGQQQRVALARILINDPELLLLDEPFGALDSYLKWQVELEVADIIKEYGRGALLVTHNRDEVYRLCDSVCVLNDGASEEKRPVKELLKSPKTMSSCLISGCKNFSKVDLIDKYTANALDWGVRLKFDSELPEDTGYVGVRAHHIRIKREPQGENCVECKVDRVVEDVFSAIVMLAPVGGTTPLRISGGKNLLEKYKAGETVYALLPPEGLMPLKD